MKHLFTLVRRPMPARLRRDARRVAVTAAVLAGHGLVLMLLLMHAAPDAGLPSGAGTVALDLVGISTAEAAPQPAKKRVAKAAAIRLDPVSPEGLTPADSQTELSDATIAPTLDTSEPTLSDADAQALAQFQPAAAAGADGQACDLTPAVVRDFAQNPVVRQGVAELPAAEKSVANAVQMWDGTWPAETRTGGQALLRALLVREITAARPDCLRRPNTGPVFFMVPDGAATVVVAVGSGQWNWGQLID